MTRTITGAAVALTLCALAIIPTFSSALSANEIQDQINELLRRLAELQGQISQNATPSTSSAPSSSGSAQCVKLTRNLSVGQNDAQTGGEVSRLQTYLTQTGDYTYGSVTGYFGPATEVAVQKWQCREMQLCSGSPDTNGYGFVGPRTRAVMAAKCTGTTPPAPTPPVYCPTDVKSCPNGGYVTRTGPSCSFPACPSSNNDLTTGASCTLDGVTISHGSSRIFFKPSIFSNSSNDSCPSQIRACKDGTLQGDVAYSRASCTNTGFMPASCTFNGATVSDGASVTAYQSANVPSGSICVSQVRACTNGTLSGTYSYASCSVTTPTPTSGQFSATPTSGSAPLTVTFVGSKSFAIPGHGPYKVRIVFGDGSISPEQNCDASSGLHVCTVSMSHTYTHVGTYTAKIEFLTGSSQHAMWTGTIVVGGSTQGSSCTFSGRAIPHGSSTTAFFFQTAGPGTVCVPETRLCSNGVLNGSAAYASCTSTWTPYASCSFNGRTLPNGASVTAYRESGPTSAVPVCTSEERRCMNGALSGSYPFETCSVGMIISNVNASPMRGSAPLSVAFSGEAGVKLFDGGTNSMVGSYVEILFGDGSKSTPQSCVIITNNKISCPINAVAHTYTTPGTHIAQVWMKPNTPPPTGAQATLLQTINIQVTSGALGVASNSQIATALAAIESLLGQIMGLLH